MRVSREATTTSAGCPGFHRQMPRRQRCPQICNRLHDFARRPHCAFCGELVSLLPGVYATLLAASDPLARMRATNLWEPNAVLTHEAAGWLTFWPDVRVAQIRCATPTRTARRASWQTPGSSGHRSCDDPQGIIGKLTRESCPRSVGNGRHAVDSHWATDRASCFLGMSSDIAPWLGQWPGHD